MEHGGRHKDECAILRAIDAHEGAYRICELHACDSRPARHPPHHSPPIRTAPPISSLPARAVCPCGTVDHSNSTGTRSGLSAAATARVLSQIEIEVAKIAISLEHTKPPPADGTGAAAMFQPAERASATLVARGRDAAPPWRGQRCHVRPTRGVT